MRSSRRDSRRPRSSTGRLDLEQLETRAVLSLTVGLPIAPSSDGTEPPPSVAPQPVISTLALVMPTNVPNGMPVRVAITALNANNFPVKYYGTVALTSSDPLATFPATVTLRDGRAVFTATFLTVGRQSLTATDVSNAALTAMASTTVAEPLVAARLVATMPGEVRNGVATGVFLSAVTADGRLVPTYTGTVAVTTTDSAATVPATVTFVGGRAFVSATFRTAGPQALTVTDQADASLTATANTVVAEPQVLTSFAVLLKSNVRSGTATEVKIMARDAAGELMRGYNGTATLTSTDSAATLPATVTFREGRAAIRVTFVTVGPQSLTVTGGPDGAITATASTTVAPPLLVTRFAVLMPRFAAVGMPLSGRLVALDASGRVVTSFGGTVNLTSSDLAAVLPATVTFRGGYATVRVTFNTVGLQTLTATDASDAAIVGSATISVSELRIARESVSGPR